MDHIGAVWIIWGGLDSGALCKVLGNTFKGSTRLIEGGLGVGVG